MDNSRASKEAIKYLLSSVVFNLARRSHTEEGKRQYLLFYQLSRASPNLLEDLILAAQQRLQHGT